MIEVLDSASGSYSALTGQETKIPAGGYRMNYLPEDGGSAYIYLNYGV